MPDRKKKYKSGEGSLYMSRNQAMRKLQLSLKDFRRLCIIKGIYPREPRNRKRAQKGDPGIQTLYHKKDIQFLLHEPIIWKFREIKTHGRRIGRAKTLKDRQLVAKLLEDRPYIKLDHIVKERYPTFIDALRDLDDCLTLCTLFATFPKLHNVPPDQSSLCRRLTLEFMHAVIAGKALRKVFISIKGYYFQAEFKGQLITWICPHQFSFQPQAKDEVDFKIMATFVQFYIILLGFVNFRLYHCLNLFYPPKFPTITDTIDSEIVDDESYMAERIAALNLPLQRSSIVGEEENVELDTFNMSEDPSKVEETQNEIEKINRLKTLFNGLKVFLNREVPREPLTFVLKCFGAEVSWDKNLFLGASFDESDETITHQIVDRPNIDKQFISRYYVQPQWVFDSVNARELLPVEKYLIGCILPPHLSPFVDPNKTQYIPEIMENETEENEAEEKGVEEEKDEEEVDKDEEEEADLAGDSNNSQQEDSDASEDDASEDDSDKEKKKELKKKMAVKPGKITKEDPNEVLRQQRQEYKLREKMVQKKHRALYASMMKGRRDRARDIKVLQKKRVQLKQQKVTSK